MTRGELKNKQQETLIAKRQYKQAYEAGDADKVLEAQEKLTAANIKTDKLKNFTPPALQTEEDGVQVPQESQAPAIDERASDWAKENTWFGQDKEMTGYAMGLHEKLVSEGVNPSSDEYYETINSRMQSLFPDSFEGEAEETETKRQPNVVAPATRSAAPKKVTLTQTQVAIAKRLGVPLELYAKKVAEEMRKI